jgi:hypothetical protein
MFTDFLQIAKASKRSSEELTLSSKENEMTLVKLKKILQH